jgi:hypothetical protein
VYFCVGQQAISANSPATSSTSTVNTAWVPPVRTGLSKYRFFHPAAVTEDFDTSSISAPPSSAVRFAFTPSTWPTNAPPCGRL